MEQCDSLYTEMRDETLSIPNFTGHAIDTYIGGMNSDQTILGLRKLKILPLEADRYVECV